VSICPTTGLRIEGQHAAGRRRRNKAQLSPEAPERLLGWVLEEKYCIRKVIGEGGMSAVYEAEHLGLDRAVAIKVLHPSLADDPEAIARLRHEALVVSAIGHPNICEVFDLGRTAEGSPYLVMERLVGESLAERIEHFGPMSFGELAPLTGHVLAALDAAHRKSILHRDLKPENVFVEHHRSGRLTAKLLDFGISKSMGYDFEEVRLTHTGMVMGTPYYMAPEQARGDSTLDQRVDLWAVGVILYEALTARRPFVATNYNALLVKILTSRPRPIQKIVPSIPDAVAALVDKALSKMREDRFQSAREFIQALEQVRRACVAEDPHEPTLMIRRPRSHGRAQPNNPVAGADARDWSAEIEDPDTFIDDDERFDGTGLAVPIAAKETRPEGSMQPMNTWDDYVPEPTEPTLVDRMPDDDWPEDGDTDRDHTRRPGTGVMSSPEVERDMAVSGVSRSAVQGDGEKTKVFRGLATELEAEDDEKTTLYDIDAANAALKRRQRDRDGGDQGEGSGTGGHSG
jgi:serine/threonine protein kinase